MIIGLGAIGSKPNLSAIQCNTLDALAAHEAAKRKANALLMYYCEPPEVRAVHLLVGSS